MIINHNLPGMNAINRMNTNSATSSKSMEKLSSGLRINKAGDDAAGLAISEKMRGQIRGLDQASANAQDSISMIQTAEGALGETHSILQRMRELAVQSSNDTNVAVDRSEIQKEMDELAKEVTRISNNTEFNTQKLINGGINDTGIKSAKFHVGANANQDITLSINAMDAKTLGISRDKVTSATGVAGGDADLSSATFAGSTFGAGVANGNVATINYVAAVAANAGTVSTLTAGAAAAPTTDMSAKTASMTVQVGTKSYTLPSLAAWNNDATHNDLDELRTFIGTAGDGAGGKLSDVANITHDGSKLSITLKTAGATALTVTFGGADAATAATLTGITSGVTNTGNAVVQAQSAKLNITSSLGHAQSVAIADPAAVTATVSTGNFQGMTINTVGGKTLADLAGATVTMTAQSTAAAAAQFSSGSFVAEATTEAGIDVSTQANGSSAITTIQNAIETVSAERSKLGAYQNRLEHTINNLGTSSENLTSAESRIRDVDMAKEMSTFSKNNILAQAAQAMLAQANQQPQQVLQLLR